MVTELTAEQYVYSTVSVRTLVVSFGAIYWSHGVIVVMHFNFHVCPLLSCLVMGKMSIQLSNKTVKNHIKTCLLVILMIFYYSNSAGVT